MAGTKEIKRRIKSVKNTKKITKAMELVSASKMKRAVAKTLASRLYATYSWELLTSISGKLDEATHPFFTENTEGKTLIILITSNRGLCGGYNAQVIKKTILKIKSLENEQVEFLTIGKKGDAAMRRVGQDVVASFLELPDIISLYDINPISKFISGEYKAGVYKNVYVAYTDFISALTQTPRIRKLLPVSKKELKKAIQDVGDQKSRDLLDTKQDTGEYIFEGDTDTLIESLAEKLVKMQIYQMLLESNASEQSSRMISMKNAGDAAGEMIDDLTLMFNKARQANITREISEISAGMASVS
ncbi:MAG: ATP synthase F1 subunit gamma [Candidatus Pacebacteria bacterium]|nr:ATP synthase F1 subunit gamma [Candidatus Paceibacterota bacterium]MBP9851532.1 ATP synthase F1 subunit gamma [Candidatus Paceibacterota bacterium]